MYLTVVATAIAFGALTHLHAQDIEPRAYSNAPIGVNFLIAGYAYTEGAVPFDASLPIKNAQLRTSNAVLAYARVLDLWGNSGKFDIIVPSLSILAEPPVTVVDKNVDRKGTRAVAQAYLEYLYTDEGQDIAGKNFYRPAVSDKAKAKYAKQFPKLNLFTIDAAFGGWNKAAKDHFADNASFDQIYTRK